MFLSLAQNVPPYNDTHGLVRLDMFLTTTSYSRVVGPSADHSFKTSSSNGAPRMIGMKGSHALSRLD